MASMGEITLFLKKGFLLFDFFSPRSLSLLEGMPCIIQPAVQISGEHRLAANLITRKVQSQL